ncbi:MAG: RAMP superfamily CRISPR-associated protein, partial [Candidatus Poribacteria bacterium]|nr:RAMP superfamily CRISPR-associated protein [Candidatus Poribacteria bacterium]
MEQYYRGRERNYDPPAPKPYDLVPLPRRVRRDDPKRMGNGHEKYRSDGFTGRISGTIEALSPIHVASGIVDLGQDVPLIKTAVRGGGRIVIPGSSLKGA